jgi:5'(3')-deoxyribonucleotidase
LKKTIAVDLDSTLNNLDEVWIAKYNYDWNDNKTKLDMTDWDTSKIVKPECGKDIFKYFHEEGFFSKLGIQPHAKEVMQWLNEEYEVYIVTAYHWAKCQEKAEWVMRYLPFFDIKKLTFLNNKFMFHADYLIDDGGHNVEAFPNKALLFDSPCPWNWYLGDKFERVHNWEEIEEFFRIEKKWVKRK